MRETLVIISLFVAGGLLYFSTLPDLNTREELVAEAMTYPDDETRAEVIRQIDSVFGP